jgi:hypothetical protein
MESSTASMMDQTMDSPMACRTETQMEYEKGTQMVNPMGQLKAVKMDHLKVIRSQQLTKGGLTANRRALMMAY